MPKKCTGPNIPGFAISFQGGKKNLVHRQANVCDGRIVQLIRRNNMERPVGRAFCQKCKRLVGKKIWSQLTAQMNDLIPQPPEGYIRFDSLHDRDLRTKKDIWYRYFYRRKEHRIEVDVPPAEIKRLQGFLDRDHTAKDLRKTLLREAPELIGVLKDVLRRALDLPAPPPLSEPYPPEYVDLSDPEIPPAPSALMQVPGAWILRWKDIKLTLPEAYNMNDAEFFKEEIDSLPSAAGPENFKQSVSSIIRTLREEGHSNYFLCQHQPTLQQPHSYFLEEDPVPEGNEDVDF